MKWGGEDNLLERVLKNRPNVTLEKICVHNNYMIPPCDHKNA